MKKTKNQKQKLSLLLTIAMKQEQYDIGFRLNHETINHFHNSNDSESPTKSLKKTLRWATLETKKEEERRDVPQDAGGLGVRLWGDWSAAGRRLLAAWTAVLTVVELREREVEDGRMKKLISLAFEDQIGCFTK